MPRSDAWLDRDACIALFEQFMPPTTDALLEQIAPEGWAESPLVRLRHPTPEQRYQEALEAYRQPPPFWVEEDEEEKGDPPRREDFREDDDEKPVRPKQEVLEVLGDGLWDVFSDNNDVVGPGGGVYHLGSFRGTGRFLAEFFNERYAPEDRFDYIDFYMGMLGDSDRADLTPVYEWIFRRLYALDCDWRYQFTELNLIDLGGADADDDADDPAGYDPAAAVQEEMQDEDADPDDEATDEADELEESLDDLNAEAREKARSGPPPKSVQAYETVYGAWPKGWPPPA
ncbi:MAG: hypothetical protein BRD37_00015 [Bacteroidetes bacterium QH_8_67_23]|nr:MAG: hypothetical protein BRD37_00015 [Bacteroidetes bacterium QH_8_67_23]